MAWTDDGAQPERSREELLARVERRGRQIRLRRRTAVGVTAVVALVAVALPVAALLGTNDGGDRGTEVAATGNVDTTVAAARTEPGPQPEPSTTTSPVPAGAASTTVRSGPVPTTTASAPLTAAPSTTEPPEPATPSTTEPDLGPRCGPAQIAVTVTPDKPSFGPGERVTVTSTARNQTSEPCAYFSFTLQATFKDSTGRPLGGMAGHGDNFREVALPAGHTLTQKADWDPRVCEAGPDCGPRPPGEYLVTATWSFDSPGVEATASFRLTA